MLNICLTVLKPRIVLVLMYNPKEFLSKWWRPFSLLGNCFMFFCRDLAVFIFPTLLAYFKVPIQNLEKIPHPVGRVTQSSYPVYSFTLILKHEHFDIPINLLYTYNKF